MCLSRRTAMYLFCVFAQLMQLIRPLPSVSVFFFRFRKYIFKYFLSDHSCSEKLITKTLLHYMETSEQVVTE